MNSGPSPAPDRKFFAGRALHMFGTFCLWAGLLFGAAGALGYARGWLYLALYASAILVSIVVARRTDPSIILARARHHNKDAKRFDKRIIRAYTLLTLAIAVVAGLDAGRFHWSAMPG